MKTCGDCPFYDESAGWCNFTKSEMVYSKMPECEARKAFRVCRDEIRRLRMRERGLNGFAHRLMDELDELRGFPKYDASVKRGPVGVVEEREITLDKLPGKPKATLSFVRPPKKS